MDIGTHMKARQLSASTYFAQASNQCMQRVYLYQKHRFKADNTKLLHSKPHLCRTSAFSDSLLCARKNSLRKTAVCSTAGFATVQGTRNRSANCLSYATYVLYHEVAIVRCMLKFPIVLIGSH